MDGGAREWVFNVRVGLELEIAMAGEPEIGMKVEGRVLCIDWTGL